VFLSDYSSGRPEIPVMEPKGLSSGSVYVPGVGAAPSITVMVHRGSNEIGGNCVEIATAKSRLILDVGMPLSEMMDNSIARRRKPDRSDLIQRRVIKHIPVCSVSAQRSTEFF